MYITLDRKEYPLSLHEISKIKNIIIRYFIAKLNKDHKRINNWQKYIDILFKDKNISVYDILKQGIYSLYIISTADSIVFKLNDNIKYKDTDAKLYELCKLINYGNKEVPGCYLFTDTFMWAIQNIDVYLKG